MFIPRTIMDRFFKKSMCRQLMAFALLALICMSDCHLIKKRHDGSVVSNDNESLQPEIDELADTDAEGIHSGTEVTNNGNDNNDVNNMPDIKVTSTTDVNNGIEQNFTGNNNSTNLTVDETIVPINSTNQTITILQKAKFTKEISQDDSVENKLPSKLSDKSELFAKPTARIAAVSLKDATLDENKEIQSSRIQPPNPSEKPKKLDTTFARSTERTVVTDSEVSAVPVSQSTASILSKIVQSPEISATEKIPSRISSISMPEMTEKRAKFLSEKLDTSTAHNSDASWSNLKTVGEVHHNNVTLGKSLPQDNGIISVNGKLDSEEVAVSESATTQKDGEEHETQLQKSNSTRISDVSDDNSLSSFQSSSSSNRPTNSVTPKMIITEFDKSIQKQVVNKEEPADILKPNVTELMQTSTLKATELKEGHPKIIEASTASGISPASSGVSPAVLCSTERSEAEESRERVTENTLESATERDVYTTTEEDEPTTTIEVETAEPNNMTILSHIPKVKTKENLVVETTAATSMIPTTETTDSPTTIYISPSKDDENKVHHEYVQNVVPVKSTESINLNATPTVEIASTTPEITKVIIHPTKPIATKVNSTEINQKVINDGKVREPIFSSTSTTEGSVPTTVTPINESTDAPLPVTPRSNIFAPLQPKPTPDTDTITPESPPSEHNKGVAQGEIGGPADVNAMIAIGISLVAVITLILLVGFLLVMRKRQKQLTYGQRCRPIGLDAYSLDNISVYNSVRRKSAMRTSKRAFGNAGFDDPGLKNNPLSISQLATFSQKRVSINEEFKDVPTVTARIEEVPVGCEDKNRYANVVPLPESRVHLKRVDDDEKTEYINANFVKGPKDTTHYYIACQAPLEHTVIDFWRMIWEQNSRVIIMATDLTENGIEKCAEYLPSSFVIDNHVTFGDFQITLKNREVRDKYAVSTVHLKNACTKTWRDITHFWYQWPENGVPNDEASVIAMLLEARSYLKMVTPEQSNENGQAESDLDNKISNGKTDKTKSLQKAQGPLTVHCSPGTGRTGTIIACDIAIKSLEQPTRNVDVPQIVYFVRRGRASAVQTREQYEFIYKVAHVYATKLTGPVNDN